MKITRASILVPTGALALTAALCALVAGCSFLAKPQETKYYVLDYIPTPPKERLDKGPYPFVLRARDCSIAEAYRRSQIVYRQSANQMQFYGLHLWAVDPDRMINDLVVKHLKAARLFQNVTRSVENYVPDFLMSCDIQAIEEYDSKEQWYAHLAIEYQLEDAKTNQIVWKKLYDLRKSVPQQEPVFIVRELSVLAETINDRLVQELDVVLDEAKDKSLPAASRDSTAIDTISAKSKAKP
jgi:cholesterol transport system auxiliary component